MLLEVTEKILASIYAKPMKKEEIYRLPYLKNISSYGIEYSLFDLIKQDFIIETCYAKNPKHGCHAFQYKASKKGEKYLIEHGYLD